MRIFRVPSPSYRSATRAVLWFGVVVGAGCYRYAETDVSALAPAQSVRLDVTAQGVERLRRSGTMEPRAIDGFAVAGRVARIGGDSILLLVDRSVLGQRAQATTITHNLAVLRSEVRGVQLRQLNRRKSTWAGVALGTAVVASAVFAIQRGGRASGTGVVVTPGPDNRIPWFMRITIP